jgi:hypothetical protein
LSFSQGISQRGQALRQLPLFDAQPSFTIFSNGEKRGPKPALRAAHHFHQELREQLSLH